MSHKSLLSGIAILCMSLTHPVSAQSSGNWVAGFGLNFEQSPYVGAKKNELDLQPYLAYENEGLHIGIDKVSTQIYDQNGLSIEAALIPRWDPSFPGTALFSGLKRDTTLEGGLSAEYSLGSLYASASAQHDVLSVHDGFQTSFAVGAEFETSSLEFDISVGGKYRDKNLNRYLFGVGTGETSATRSAYEPGDNWTPFVEVSVAYPLTDNIALFGFAEFEKYSKSVTGSPLVAKDKSSQIGLYLLTQF